jgi:hypothetical protein
MADRHKPTPPKNQPPVTPAEAEEKLDLAAAWIGARLNRVTMKDDINYVGGHDGVQKRINRETKRLREIEAMGREEKVLKKRKKGDDARKVD